MDKIFCQFHDVQEQAYYNYMLERFLIFFYPNARPGNLA